MQKFKLKEVKVNNKKSNKSKDKYNNDKSQTI